MLIKKKTRGFTLYEIMISIMIMRILTGLFSVSLFPFFIRTEFLKNILQQAHLLSLTQHRSHLVKSEFGNLLLQQKYNSYFDRVFKERVPVNILISASYWPSFSAFGCATRVTVTLKTETYSTKVVVSPVGLIRQTEIERK